MKTQYENLADLWKKIEQIKIGMFTTANTEGNLHSRPMTALEVDADGLLWFFSSLQSELAQDLSLQPLANISFAEPKDNFYVSLSGRAEFIGDRSQYQKLWSPLVKAWFPRGIDDPELVLIRFRISAASYWDSDASRMVQMLKMLTAAATGNRPDMGSHGEIRL
ncbi:MAG TPA: pyridoxamine 5'-phosphate oxidase family protein [Spongiibacteraceae bacterium]